MNPIGVLLYRQQIIWIPYATCPKIAVQYVAVLHCKILARDTNVDVSLDDYLWGYNKDPSIQV